MHLLKVLLQIALFRSGGSANFTIKTYLLVRHLKTFCTMISLNYCC